MADSQIITNADNYLKLSDDLSHIYEDFSSLNNKSKRVRDEYSLLEQELKKLPTLSMEFPTFEDEINQVIDSQGNIDSPKNILSAVVTYYDKIVQIDKETQNIKKAHQKLIKLPDRFGRAELTGKLSVYLKNVSNISINDLDKIIDVVIPSIKKAIKQLNSAFADEGATVDSIKQSALNLLSQLEKHKNSQDRYRLRAICSNGIITLNNIIDNPNYNDLTSDSDKVQKIQDELKQCEANFNKEKSAYKELIRDYSSGVDYAHLMWAEDANNLINILKGAIANIFDFPQTTDYVQKIIDVGVARKRSDIKVFRQMFAPKTLKFFRNEIEKIENNCVHSSELTSLKVKIDKYLKEEKKELILKILKFVGIAIGVVLSVIILVVIIQFIIEHWQWFLGGAVVVILLILFFRKR